jgi:hypothetical protein
MPPWRNSAPKGAEIAIGPLTRNPGRAKPDKKIVDRSSGEPELMEDACPARDRGFTT